MDIKSVLLTTAVLLACLASPALAQQSLGDLVTEGGYEWLIGKWVATTDEGSKLRFEQKWGLDKNTMLVDFQMGNFKMHGMIVFVPSREEVLQISADNQGGIWKGTWRDEYGDAVHRMEQTKPDGETQKAEIVHTRVDADTMKTVMYGLDSDGYRAADPWATVIYKRQPADAPSISDSNASTGSTGYYQKLGDLVSEADYGWMAGQWTTTIDDGRQVQLEYKWALDRHAVLVDVKRDSYHHLGMIIFAPSRQEVTQIGADNAGAFWEGAWSDGYDGVALKITRLEPDGVKRRLEHVYTPVDKDSFKLAEYAVDADGYRSAEPRGTQTFTRRPAKKTEK
jgi:hypothetical protein